MSYQVESCVFSNIDGRQTVPPGAEACPPTADPRFVLYTPHGASQRHNPLVPRLATLSLVLQ